jgi:glycosyltransferase involved in cell wall biosynthesis
LTKTSLIIPAWNASLTIEDCILSAIKANLSPNEIIVVDDVSTDNTVNIIENLAKKYSNIKLLKLVKNSGPAAARDYGVKASSGDLIFFTDSDTLILENTFVNCLNTIEKYKADAVSGIYHPEPINKGLAQLYKALFFYYQFARHNKPFAYETFNGQIAAIKKEVYISTGGYNKKILWGMDNENEEFGRRIIKKHLLLLDPIFQVKHNFPGFRKLTKTYFSRVSTWMFVFLEDLKFESGGPAALDSGLAAVSVPISLFFLLLSVTLSKLFLIIFLIFLLIWLFGYLKFFIFVYKSKASFLYYAIILNIWFSTVISFGALWGFLKWIKGHRIKNNN